ncbi:MAG: hypothetical protein ABIH21_04215, partial [Patescibacteria group bacterium]
MGPTLIFDKSTLQTLSFDEAVWLDQFYNVNITPMFFVETLVDLEKEVRAGKTQEEIVGQIAGRTPIMHSYVNAHYRYLLEGELSGQGEVEMLGRPVIPGGRVVKLGNETGVIHEAPQEIEAFQRWQKGDFLSVERDIAKHWRSDLLENSAPYLGIFQEVLSDIKIHKNLDELIEQTKRIIDETEQEQILLMGLCLIGASPSLCREALEVWKTKGHLTIRGAFPYFTHIISIDLFYYLGTTSGLLREYRHPQTHKIDLAYLYYLPFCNIFVSNDKFQLAVAPYFLNEEQEVISGARMKEDLNRLDDHFDKVTSSEEKNRGVCSFALIPPDDPSFIVVGLWDKFMAPKWREMRPRRFDGSDKIDAQK